MAPPQSPARPGAPPAPAAPPPPPAAPPHDWPTQDDTIAFVAAGINLVGNSLDGYNRLMDVGIPKIITDLFRVDITTANLRTSEANADVDHYGVEVKFKNVRVGRPVQANYPSGKLANFYPNQARNTGATYAAPLEMEAGVVLTAHFKDGRSETKTAEIPAFEVAQFPVMVGSNRCHTHNLTRAARKQLQEDPEDPGGYFIAKGGEWVVEGVENIRFNCLHAYLRITDKELVRGEFISQPGGPFENSSQIIIRHLVDGQLTIEINSMNFQKLQIPFYLIFRLFGITSDVEILEQVVGSAHPAAPVDRRMAEMVNDALHLAPPHFEDLADVLERQAIVEKLAVILERFVTNPHRYQRDDEAVRFLTTRLLTILDSVFLPHVGQTSETRIHKLKYLGTLIQRVLLVELKVVAPADRDSFTMKRIHIAYVSIAKMLKTMFNASVIHAIVQALKLELKQTDWVRLTPEKIREAGRTMFNASAELSQLLVRILTSGNRQLLVVHRRTTTVNRVASDVLERKNYLHAVSALRRVVTHSGSSASKGTARAEELRSVHSTSLGYVCPYHSPDTGEGVGLEKQLACTAVVCDAGEPGLLETRLAADPDVLPLYSTTNQEVAAQGLARVYINGRWVGACERPWALAEKYRALRRAGEGVSPQTTITWKLETNDLEFWLDVGRLVRPLIIVDNNQAEFDAAARAAWAAKRAGDPAWAARRVAFWQRPRFTAAHAAAIRAGRLALADLVREGVCEYVAPEEAENCFVAPSVDELRAAAADVTRPYTHCDVPQAVSGFAALVSPFANHTQPARVTYETNQARSTCGWYVLGSWPDRADHLRFLQHYLEYPLVSTLTNNYILPNGTNVFVAVMSWRGDNQEDSAMVNQAFVQRGGLGGVLLRREVVQLEKGETFGTPTAAVTGGSRSTVSCAKLRDGFVPAGTRVQSGDALVCRLVPDPAGAGEGGGKGAYQARLTVYKESVPARVFRVWKTQGPDGTTFAVVLMVVDEPLNVGDKISSRSGNKSIVARVVPAGELPYDADGNRPDLMINSHSFPTRMVIGQPIESYIALACARRGSTTDGTMFRRIGLARASDSKWPRALRELGFRESGTRTLYHPDTGMWLDAGIALGPTYIQRIAKLVDLNGYAAGPTGPTDLLTGQPLEGKRSLGGLRLGEMEVWVFVALGMMANLGQKLQNDSDGRTAWYCRRCGQPANFNAALGVNACAECGELADVVSFPTRQGATVFLHELRALGLDIRFLFPPRRFERPA